jgi:hypothetical protein
MIHLLIFVCISAEVEINSYIGDSLDNSIVGFTFFDDKQNMYLETKQPYHQIFFYLADTLVLYYPEEEKAMFFSNYDPMSFIIKQVIIASSKNFDLSKYGFRFLLREKTGDTLNYHWLLNKGKASPETRLILKFYKEKLTEMILTDKDAKILHKTEYDEYIIKDSLISLPLKVSSYSYLSNGITKEFLELSNAEFIESFPDSLKNISLPDDIEIRKW